MRKEQIIPGIVALIAVIVFLFVAGREEKEVRAFSEQMLFSKNKNLIKINQAGITLFKCPTDKLGQSAMIQNFRKDTVVIEWMWIFRGGKKSIKKIKLMG